MQNIDEYIDAIEVAVKLSGNFLEKSEEKWQYLDNNKLENGKLKKLIVCSYNYNSEVISFKRENGYARLIFRFYEDKWGNHQRMSLCNYYDGVISEDFEESLELLGKYL